MMSLLELDKSVFAWINTGWSNPVLDGVMPWITHLADGAVVWLWIVLIGLLAGRQLARLARPGQGSGPHRTAARAVGFFCLYLALVYGVNTGVCHGLKDLSRRPRPFVQQTVILRVPPATASALHDQSSFPSGHACNAFMIAAILAERFRRKRYAFYGAAALVGLSRIYLGLHYPSDVIAGACLGLTITWLMLLFRGGRTSDDQLLRVDLFP